MAEKSRFRGIAKIVARKTRKWVRGLRGGMLGSGHVEFCEVVLQVLRPDYVVPTWHVGEEASGVVEVDFVGIEPAPPVARRCFVAKMVEGKRTQAIAKVSVIGGIRNNDFRNFMRQSLDYLPRVVTACIIIHVDPVKELEVVPEAAFDEVALVLDQTDASDGHDVGRFARML